MANEGPTLTGSFSSHPPAMPLYTQRVELATQARKLLTFQIPGLRPGELRLTLRVGEIDLDPDVPLRMLGPTDFLVGCSPTTASCRTGLAAVRRGGQPGRRRQLTPADLPADRWRSRRSTRWSYARRPSDRLTADSGRRCGPGSSRAAS